MAHLLANASRMRDSEKHKQHRGIRFEDHLAKKRYWEQFHKDEFAHYEKANQLEHYKQKYYPDDCELCERKMAIKKMQDEYEAEQQERYIARQKEAEIKQKEKDREVAERRMMAMEDKPKTPPVPKKKATPQEIDAWRKLKEQEEALMAQIAKVRAEANKIDPVKNTANILHKCEICNVILTSYNGCLDADKRKKHFATRKHQINAGLMTKEVYPRHCDTCDYTAKTKHHWEQHCEGKKHNARSIQTITIPTTTELEKEEGQKDSHFPKSIEDNVESS